MMRFGGEITAMDGEPRLVTLAKAAHQLNEAGVDWALGASALLWLEGVADTFHDFDLLIAPGHMATARQAMRACGAQEQPPSPPNPAYATREFAEFRLDGVDFDLLCGFAICYNDQVIRYPFSAARVAKTAQPLGIAVPLCPLADWYVLYLLMPGRANKAEEIARYLRLQPRAEWAPWLADWLAGPLPDAVRTRVQALRGEADG